MADMVEFEKDGAGLWRVLLHGKIVGWAQQAIRDFPNLEGGRTQLKGWFALKNVQETTGADTPIYRTRNDVACVLIGLPDEADLARERKYR